MVFVVETISRPFSPDGFNSFFQQGILNLKSWQLLWEMNMLRSMSSNKIVSLSFFCR